MTDPVVDQVFRLQTIVTVVDAIHGEHNLETYEASVRQVAIADRLVISKSDIAEGTDALAAHLGRLNPSAPIDDVHAPTVDFLSLFSGPSNDATREPLKLVPWINEAAYRARHVGHLHHRSRIDGGEVIATCITFEKPLDWTAFTIWLTMLLHGQGKNLLRIKGLLNVEGQSGPVVFQGVQHIVSPPVHVQEWPDEDRRSRLVFITWGLEPEMLKQSLSAFDHAGRISGDDQVVSSKRVPMSLGTEVEGRPYRRVTGLSWMK
jgi:G3E family GTPase